VTDAFREGAVHCPACGEILMAACALDGATVDVCGTCQGMWVDRDDGDLAHITKAASESASGSPLLQLKSVDDVRAQYERLRKIPLPMHTCPRCAHALVGVTYGTFRCGECAGSFVARPALDDARALIERARQAEHQSAMAQWEGLSKLRRRWVTPRFALRDGVARVWASVDKDALYFLGMGALALGALAVAYWAGGLRAVLEALR
jgi:Zn-finger nucleic acid-binding protein